jgi:ribose transport system ATP-binding protein
VTGTATEAAPLLVARDVVKDFGAVLALQGADIVVPQGRIEALVGKNGAGKSTLMKVLTGVVEPDAGEITMLGEPVQLRSVRASQELGIILVPQEITLFGSMTVAENLLTPARYHRRTSAGVERRRPGVDDAAAVLERIGLDIDLDTTVDTLGLPVQRALMIARGLLGDPRLLILDEPTEAFTESEVERLFSILRELAASGVSIVYVSHRLDEVVEISDGITVLRDGKTVVSLRSEKAAIDRNELVRAIVGEEASRLVQQAKADSAGATEPAATEPVLEVRDLRAPGLAGVSLDARGGEVVGICGLAGSGRSHLLQTIYGLQPRLGGTVSVVGEVEQQSRLGALFGRRRESIFLVPEDRRGTGLFLDLSIRENVSLPIVRRARHSLVFPWINRRRERALIEPALAAVGLEADIERPIGTLSGGNQQKALLARSFVSGARVWLLDEPTVGLDVAARVQILGIVRRAVRGLLPGAGSAGARTTAIVVSSDFEDLALASDRAYVLRGRAITDELAGGELTEERMLAAASFDAEDEPWSEEQPAE